MLSKLKPYQNFIENDFAKSAKILDPRFGNDLVWVGDFLRKFIHLPVGDVSSVAEDETGRRSDRSLVEELGNERSSDSPYEHEKTRFLRATSTGDRGMDPLGLCLANEDRFSKLARFFWDILSSKSSSVASESRLFCAGNVVEDSCARSSDDIISACLRLHSWHGMVA